MSTADDPKPINYAPGTSAAATPSTSPFTERARSELIGRFKTRGWMTLREFAIGVADISYQTVTHWASTGMIKFTQVGGVKRVYEEEIARFLRDGTLEPDPKAWEAQREIRRQYEQNYRLHKSQGKVRQYDYSGKYKGGKIPKKP